MWYSEKKELACCVDIQMFFLFLCLMGEREKLKKWDGHYWGYIAREVPGDILKIGI
jgi:hypothetical protein